MSLKDVSLKTSILCGVVILLVSLGLLLITVRNEFFGPLATELDRNPQWEPFLIGVHDFIGLYDFSGYTHHFDTGTYEFTFRTTFTQPQAYFEEVQQLAEAQGWEIVRSHPNAVSYVSIVFNERIELEYRENDNLVYFRRLNR